MIRAVAPGMAAQGFGRIVNITSINGLRGKFGQANYAAAKAGLIGLTKTAAREFGKKGVTVNAVAPGMVMTEMARALPPEILARRGRRGRARRAGRSRRHQQRGAVPAVGCRRAPSPARCCASTPGNISEYLRSARDRSARSGASADGRSRRIAAVMNQREMPNAPMRPTPDWRSARQPDVAEPRWQPRGQRARADDSPAWTLSGQAGRELRQQGRKPPLGGWRASRPETARCAGACRAGT